MSNTDKATIILKKFPARSGWDAHIEYKGSSYTEVNYRTKWGALFSAYVAVKKVKRRERLKAKPVKIKEYRA